MNTNNEITGINNLPEVEQKPQELPNNEELLHTRYQEVYNQLLETNDPAEMTAILLSFSHYYSYGLIKSNEINDRQGKNRLTVEHGTYKLNQYSMDIEVDTYKQEQVQNMVAIILNSYLSNKQVLPTNQPKKAKGILSRVKALYINLFFTNNYGFINKLDTPSYMSQYVHDAFSMLKEMREESLNGLIEYLESIDEYEAASIVRETGESAWKSIKTNTKTAFESAFGKVIDKIHNLVAVEKAYREFRGKYKKSSHSIGPNGLYDLFETTEDAYNKARRNVFTELAELSSEDGQLKIINSLLHER